MPVHLIREHRNARQLRPDSDRSDFDRIHGVNTDGEFGGWTYLSDLEIASNNWIEANDYRPIELERFGRIMAKLDLPFEEYTFIDFGSGKGRALLLASEFPFQRIIGLEFSPELHRIAEENIGLYQSETQRCKDIQSQNVDFVTFALPREPLVLFFFDPCHERVLSEILNNLRDSLRTVSRPLFLIYVAPRADREKHLNSCEFLTEMVRDSQSNFCIYRAQSGVLKKGD